MPAPPKSRKPADPLEKNARAQLLETALEAFGRYGFEATTTRIIARSAGVNLALISYYFDGKEGLYRAVIDLVAGRIESHLEPVLHQIDQIEACTVKSPEQPAQAAALVEMVLNRMVDLMVGSTQATRFSRVIVREQLYPSAFYDIIFNRIMKPVIEGITRLLLVIGPSADPVYTRLRALSLLGQVMVFRVARETVVRLMGMQGYTAAETEQVRRVVLEQTRMTIARWAAEGRLTPKEDNL